MTTTNVAPVADVKIADDKGFVLDLRSWFRSYERGTTDEAGGERDTVPALTSLTIDLKEGGAAEVKVGTSMRYDTWKRLVDDHGTLFLPGAVISASIGYDDRMTRTYKAVVVKSGPSVTYNEDFVDVEITGSAAPWFSSRTDTNAPAGSHSDSGESSVNVWDYVQEIADANGLKIYTLEKDGSEKEVTGGPSGPLSILDNDLKVVPKGSDWAKLRGLLNTYGRLEFYTHSDRIVVYDPSEQLSVSEIPTFVWRGGNPSGDRFPLIDLDTKSHDLSLIRSSQKVVSKDIDSGSREITTEEAKESDSGTNEKGMRKNSHPDERNRLSLREREGRTEPSVGSPGNRKGQPLSVSADDPRRKEKTQREKQLGQRQSGIRVTGTTLLHPYLVPGRAIRIMNATSLLNGIYQVVTATNSMDASSGATTEFQAITVGVSDLDGPAVSEYDGSVESAQGKNPESASGDTIKKSSE